MSPMLRNADIEFNALWLAKALERMAKAEAKLTGRSPVNIIARFLAERSAARDDLEDQYRQFRENRDAPPRETPVKVAFCVNGVEVAEAEFDNCLRMRKEPDAD